MSTETIIIPKDIKRYVLKKRAARIIYLAVLLAAAVGVGVIFRDLLLKWGDGILGLYYVLAVIFCLFKAGVPFKMIDKSYSGEIIKSAIFEGKEVKQGSPTSWEAIRFRLSVWLTIKTDDGEIIRREAIHDIEEHEKTLRGTRYAYKEGMRVVHIAGTKFIGIVPDENRATINCCVCGDNFPKENEKCPKCGHTLHIMKGN